MEDHITLWDQICYMEEIKSLYYMEETKTLMSHFLEHWENLHLV